MSQLSQVIRLKNSAKISALWLPVAFVLGVGAILTAIIFAMLAYQVLFLDKIYPGVQVNGIAAGGMTPAEVVAALSQRPPQPLIETVTIEAGAQRWTFTAQQLGMRVNAAATVDQAYAVGRQGSFLADLQTQLRLLNRPVNVEPVLGADSGPLNQALAQMAAEYDQPPQDARLIIHPDGSLETAPARRGRRIHPDVTRARLQEALQQGFSGPVQEAATQEIIPAITDADIELARQQAQNLLGQPLTFRFMAETEALQWTLEPTQLAALVDLAEVTDSTGNSIVALSINWHKMAPYFDEFARVIQRDPQDARLAFDPELNQVQVLEPGLEGRALNSEAAYRQLAALPQTLAQKPAPVFDLPLTVTPPVIFEKNIDQLGITELVSESTSYFKGSSDGRMKNIAVAAAKFNGVIIFPGQIFSFNRHLGEITKDNGYDESLIIYGDRTTVGVGGGVCQVSTTAFRAAFFGGFELVERWAHGYRVGWYETNAAPGLDATIYTPDVDFKFRNDTPYHVLIQTESDLEAGTVTFRFYSTATGRQITVSDPEITSEIKHGPPRYEKDPSLPKGTVKQVDWAIDGMDVTITRTVTLSDTVLHRDAIHSEYKPWQAVYRVGTGEEARAGGLP